MRKHKVERKYYAAWTSLGREFTWDSYNNHVVLLAFKDRDARDRYVDGDYEHREDLTYKRALRAARLAKLCDGQTPQEYLASLDTMDEEELDNEYL